MEARQAELLPAEYFHVVFTLPPACGRSLCKTVARSTVSCSALSPRHCSRSLPIRGTSGPRSVSWRSCTPGARTSCIIPTCIASYPAAGSQPTFAVDRLSRFFLPVRVLSPVFRGKFLTQLRGAFKQGKLAFRGKLSPLADPSEFHRLLAASARVKWVVYSKPPTGGPNQVLKYLARYTHRVAISNQRLIALEDGKVRFRWKDYAHGGAPKTMALNPVEFIRRFLLHVLPSGFVRIRHYGFLANRVRHDKLALCRALLGVKSMPEPMASEASDEPKEPRESQTRTSACPRCGVGRMVIIDVLRATPINRRKLTPLTEAAELDTS